MNLSLAKPTFIFIGDLARVKFNNKQAPGMYWVGQIYHQTYNIGRTLVGNKIVDLSDVVGAAPVRAAPTTSSFMT